MNTIDAVWTWVDGNDPLHSQKLNNYLKESGIARPIAALPTRFANNGELEYSVRSVLKFAPWVRNLYIVTPSQRPNFLGKPWFKNFAHKVFIIDEKEIFAGFTEFLPTFNSISIESLLWRIPGLSEKFIYFNDDWCLLNPVEPTDFFIDNKLVIRGRWRRQSQIKSLAYYVRQIRQKEIDPYRLVQENSARLAGFKKHFFELPHVPIAAKLSIFREIFNDENLLINNIKYNFRSEKQFLPFGLVQHLALQNHLALIDKRLQAIYIHADLHDFSTIKQLLARAQKNQDYKFICMQSLDLLDDLSRTYIFDWLDTRI